MMTQLRILRFNGFHPDTLGHYFAALGCLAAVNQKWPGVRGCWRNRRFLLLHESLTKQHVTEHLINTWKPTPYERWWEAAQKADTKSKSSSEVWLLRNSRSIDEVRVLDCHLVGLNRNQFNPVFGTGGALGQRDFADVWRGCLNKARPKSKEEKAAPNGPAKPKKLAGKKSKARQSSEAWLDATLTGDDKVELPTVTAAGTWFAFANKSFNTGQDWFREGRLSPWTYLLAVEGAFLMAGDANRRLGIRAQPYAVFPFVSDPAQPTTTGELGMSRGEFWAPLWDCPATVTEVRELLRRGQARLGNRSAHAPHEFAIAALAAGADAGVSEFIRFELRHTTTTQYCYEAIPRETVRVGPRGPVSRQTEPDPGSLLKDVSRWLNQLPVDTKGKPFRGLRGPVESAIIRIGENPDDSERWQQLLLLLSLQQARIDRNKPLRETLAPLPWLNEGWFARAWPERLCTDEVELARAIASVGAGTGYPIVSNIFSVEFDRQRKPSFVKGDRSPRAVWNDGEPLRTFGQILHRRLLDTEPGHRFPVGGTCPAPLATIAQLLDGGEMDLRQVAIWVVALSLIDWKETKLTVPRISISCTGELALLGLFRPVFHEDPGRLLDERPNDPKPALARRTLNTRLLPQAAARLLDPKPALARRILNMIQSGDLEEAIGSAKRFYQAAGRSVLEVPKGGPHHGDFPARLSAALLVPQTDYDVRRGLHRWLIPEKSNPK
jgi:CRISPR-associated protein Csx17